MRITDYISQLNDIIFNCANGIVDADEALCSIDDLNSDVETEGVEYTLIEIPIEELLEIENTQNGN